MYDIWYTGKVSKTPSPQPESSGQSRTLERQGKRVPAIFYRTEAGGEPVRDWLRGLSPEDKKRIGEDIKTVEFGWPIGMPVCRPLGEGIYEVMTSLTQNRIARVLFYKKTRKTPAEDLGLARSNKSKHQRGLP